MQSAAISLPASSTPLKKKLKKTSPDSWSGALNTQSATLHASPRHLFYGMPLNVHKGYCHIDQKSIRSWRAVLPGLLQHLQVAPVATVLQSHHGGGEWNRVHSQDCYCFTFSNYSSCIHILLHVLKYNFTLCPHFTWVMFAPIFLVINNADFLYFKSVLPPK